MTFLFRLPHDKGGGWPNKPPPIFSVTDEAIIRAEYVEWKMVKTRKALQLIFEVPLEHQALVQAALGTPMPDVSTPVYIARLATEAELSKGIDALTVPAEIEPPRKPASLAQIAGILCNEGGFQKWCGAKDKDEAAQYIRDHCEVDSRAHISGNENAMRVFADIRASYEAWLRDAA